MASPAARKTGTVVVIGGGMGGAAAALQLRASGHAVVLVEKNPHLGGIAAGFERNGVRGFYPLGFADYPSFAALFASYGKRVEDYVEVIRQEGLYTRFLYDDGESLDLGDLEFSARSLEKRSAEHAKQYRRLYDFSERLFRGHVQSSAAYAEAVAEHVEDEAVRMAINYRTFLLGENPYSTSSFYLMMLHMQELWGPSFTAPGGIGGLVEPLERLMADAGIEVVKGDGVKRLACSQGRIERAVLQSGRELPCSHVISDISPHDLYGRLLPKESGATNRKVLGQIEYSPSVFSYHFTTRACHASLPSTLVVFPRDFARFCSQVYEEGVMPDELLLGEVGTVIALTNNVRRENSIHDVQT